MLFIHIPLGGRRGGRGSGGGKREGRVRHNNFEGSEPPFAGEVCADLDVRTTANFAVCSANTSGSSP